MIYSVDQKSNRSFCEFVLFCCCLDWIGSHRNQLEQNETFLAENSDIWGNAAYIQSDFEKLSIKFNLLKFQLTISSLKLCSMFNITGRKATKSVNTRNNQEYSFHFFWSVGNLESSGHVSVPKLKLNLNKWRESCKVERRLVPYFVFSDPQISSTAKNKVGLILFC